MQIKHREKQNNWDLLIEKQSWKPEECLLPFLQEYTALGLEKSGRSFPGARMFPLGANGHSRNFWVLVKEMDSPKWKADKLNRREAEQPDATSLARDRNFLQELAGTAAQVGVPRLGRHCSLSEPFPAGTSSSLFPGTTNLPDQWSSSPACSSVWPSFWLFLLLQPAEKSIQQSDLPSASFPGEEKGEQKELNLKSP